VSAGKRKKEKGGGTTSLSQKGERGGGEGKIVFVTIRKGETLRRGKRKIFVFGGGREVEVF